MLTLGPTPSPFRHCGNGEQTQENKLRSLKMTYFVRNLLSNRILQKSIFDGFDRKFKKKVLGICYSAHSQCVAKTR